MFESAELGHNLDKATFEREAPALRQALLVLDDLGGGGLATLRSYGVDPHDPRAVTDGWRAIPSAHRELVASLPVALRLVVDGARHVFGGNFFGVRGLGQRAYHAFQLRDVSRPIKVAQ